MIQKALILNCLNFPLAEVEAFSIEEREKWAAAAYWIKSEIDLAPYKQKK